MFNYNLITRSCIIIAVIFIILFIALFTLSFFISYSFVFDYISSISHTHKLIDFPTHKFYTILYYIRLFIIAIIAIDIIILGLLIYKGNELYVIVNRFLTIIYYDYLLLYQSMANHINDNKFVIYLLLSLTILATANRYIFLFQPMRYDEAATYIYYASRPFFIVISRYDSPNNHIFHSILVHLSTSLFGNYPSIIRLPAFLAGVLMIPACYLVGTYLYNQHTGLISAALVASSSIFIEYSTNARGYTLLVLLFLMIFSLGAYLQNNRNIAGWLLFIVFTSLGFYTIPIMFYPFGIVVLWMSLSIIINNSIDPIAKKLFFKDLIISLCLIFSLILILYAPIFTISGVNAVVGNKYIQQKPLTEFISQLPNSLYITFKIWNRDIPNIIIALFIIGCVISLVFYKKVSAFKFPFFPMIFFWCLIVLLIQRVVPFVRVWLFLLPIYFILVSSGILIITKKLNTKWNEKVPIIIIIILSIVLNYNILTNNSILNSLETGTLKDAERITVFMKYYLHNTDAILAKAPSSDILIYYFKKYNMSLNYFYIDQALNKRYIIIVNKEWNQTINDVLQTKRFTKELSLINMKAIKDYESAIIYEINIE